MVNLHSVFEVTLEIIKVLVSEWIKATMECFESVAFFFRRKRRNELPGVVCQICQ